MFLSGVLSKRDGRAEEPDVDGVALALPPVAGKGDRQLGATDGHAPVFSDDRGVVGICKLITGGGGEVEVEISLPFLAAKIRLLLHSLPSLIHIEGSGYNIGLHVFSYKVINLISGGMGRVHIVKYYQCQN